MKKTLLTATLILGIALSGSAFAATTNTSNALKNFKNEKRKEMIDICKTK